jgi:DNA-binding LacI/PurR family transcriptional regulator
MSDIAAHLGVSRQLVSIVLRELPGASSKTRERVMTAARELGYSPNIGARTLRQTRSRHIGVAFAPAHSSEPDIVEAIYSAASDHGYQVVLSAQTRSRSTAQAVEELLGYRCAAMIVVGSDLSVPALRTLSKRVKVPMVVVGGGERSASFDVIRSAGDVGIALAVAHLVELGHRQIAYVHCGSMPSAALRLRGYRRAMARAGLEQDVVAVNGRDFTELAGAAAGRRVLDRSELPTAIVAGNDQQAVAVLQVLTRAKVDIPGMVSLTGFDNSRVARLPSVELTSASQDPEQMGRAAVEAAVRRIGQSTATPSIFVVDSHLVVRTSTTRSR